MRKKQAEMRFMNRLKGDDMEKSRADLLAVAVASWRALWDLTGTAPALRQAARLAAREAVRAEAAFVAAGGFDEKK